MQENAKRAAEGSTALVAKEEKEAPYDYKDTIDEVQLLDGKATTTLRKGYAERLTVRDDEGILRQVNQKSADSALSAWQR
jgi:hypothetical protein